jgi:hypothetical protein
MTSHPSKQITEFVLRKSSACQNVMSDCSDCGEALAVLNGVGMEVQQIDEHGHTEKKTKVFDTGMLPAIE